VFVYLIENVVNGKYYVGKTVHHNLNSYLSVKRWAARHNIKSAPIVSAMSEYGIDSFEVSVLGTAPTSDQLNELERLWIILLNARDPNIGYNVCVGGSTGRLGLTTSEETKKKIGLANKGRKPKGYVRTELHRQQLRDRMMDNTIGVKITPEIAVQWKAAETNNQKQARYASIKASWDRRKAEKVTVFVTSR
jgi:group I intron endonuclease